jgi:hypothetical protein
MDLPYVNLVKLVNTGEISSTLKSLLVQPQQLAKFGHIASPPRGVTG